MPFWLVLVLFAASVVLGQLFRPKIAGPKPGSFADLDFPTAEETRVVPKIYGTVKMKAPNVVSVPNDFSFEPIVKKTRNPGTLFLTTTKQTQGYRYYCGIEMALGYQIDALLAIEIGDKVAWSGEVTTDSEILINNKTLFGGDDAASGGNGGVYGYLNVHLGSPTAAKDAYLLAEYGNYSAHRGRSYVVWQGQHRAKGSGYLGNSTRAEAWAFVARSIPTNIPGGAAYANINSGDANPAEVIYDVMRNSEYAVGMNGAFIDDASFLAAAQVFHTDGYGCSFEWNASKPCRDVINSMLQLTDSVLYSDLSTGKMVLKAARADYVVDDLLHLNESNIINLVSFTRGAWAETTNEVRVAFIDRTDSFVTKPAIAQDLANARIQTGVVASNVQHVGISNPATGGRIAQRDLRALTSALAKVTLQANRQAGKVTPGSVFKLSWAKIKDELGNPISNMPMRVIGVKKGDSSNPIIEIEAVEDVFNSTAAVLAVPPVNGSGSNVVAPAPATLQTLQELPLMLAGDDAQPKLWALAAAPNAGNYTFDLFDSDDNVTYEGDDLNNAFTPTGVLANAYAQNTSAIDGSGTLKISGAGIDLEKLTAATPGEIAAGRNLMAVIEGTKVELMAFESYTIDGSGFYVLNNVWRGLMDTTPKAFGAGARVWFVSYGDGRGELGFLNGATAYGKIITKSLQGALSEGGATALNVALNYRALRPYAPGNLRINGSFTGTTVPGSGDVVFAWSHRDRTRQNSVIAQDSNAVPGIEGGAQYHIKIYNQAGTLIINTSNITGTSYTLTNAAETAANGGALAGALTVVLYAERDGITSWQAQVRGVSRDGSVPSSPAFAPAGVYVAPPAGNATSIGGVPVTGTPSSTNNTPVFDPVTGVITWQPGGGSVTIREIDGSPSGTASVIEVPNGQLTSMGGGVFRVTPLQGATGAAGAAGATWYTGSAVPAVGTGVDGDFYLRLGVTGNGDVYQKAGGAWSVVGSIQGPQGVPGAAGLSSRASVTVNTGSIASGATANIPATVAKGYDVYAIETSAAAWVRVYSTSAARTADAARLQTDDPTGEHGLMAEVTTISGNLIISFNPPANGYNNDLSVGSTAYLAVTNQSGAAADIAVTITYIELEA